MKKITLMSLIFSVSCLKGYSQLNDKHFVIKSNALTLLTLTPNLSFEAKTYNRTSIALGVMAVNKTLNSGATAWADYRFYLGYKETPTLKGFYLAPGVMLSNDNQSKENFHGIGGNIGYQWFDNKKVKKNNFCVDFNFGLYKNLKTNDNAFVAVLPKLTIGVGWAIGK